MQSGLLLFVVALAACSSSTETPSTIAEDAAEEVLDDTAAEDTDLPDEGIIDSKPEGDSKPATDSKPAVDTAVVDMGPPAPCSDLTLPAAIDGKRWGDKKPDAVGGALPSEGTWDLFDATQYGATSGTLGKFAGAFRVKGDKYDLRMTTPTGTIESSGTFKTAGTTINFATTCTIGAFATSPNYDVGVTYVRLHTSTTIYSFKTR